MCGIAGFFNFRDQSPADPLLVEGMTETLRHRGPDDRGFFVQGPVALGMRRLSIIDIEGGGQPLRNEEGSIQLVCNGEIYNHVDMRRDLESRGHRFRSRSDAEVLVHAYEEYGIDFLSRLNGMYAFALWDGRSRQLLLARDRLGIKPLYVAETHSGIVFASELKAFLLHPQVRTDLDATAVRQYLAWEFIPAPRTPWTGVRKLMPATYLRAGIGRVQQVRYWQISQDEVIQDPTRAADELRAHLLRAVRLQLEADVPVGAFLSGGLDSSAIVAMMKEAGADPIHTFSIGFTEADFNEVRHARSVARALGTRHEDEILSARCGTLIEEVAEWMDEPFADTSILPTYLLSRLARAKVKVVLSGDGADELFGGYDRYKAARVGEWYARLPGIVREGLRRALGSRNGGAARKRGTLADQLYRLERAIGRPPALEHARWMVRTDALLQRDLVGGSMDREDSWTEPMRAALEASPFRSGLNRQLEVDVNTYLPDDILFKLDRSTMAASLEARVPYLDHELVEFAFRVPGDWKLRGLEGKWILRRAMRGSLPAETLRRRKSGFTVPIGVWLRRDLRSLASDLLAPERLKREGILEPIAVSKILQDHGTGRVDNSRTLWALVVLELWSTRFLERRDCSVSSSLDRHVVTKINLASGQGEAATA
jgi:asparagine synthase (glutamine-hydrolysing)